MDEQAQHQDPEDPRAGATGEAPDVGDVPEQEREDARRDAEREEDAERRSPGILAEDETSRRGPTS